MFLAMLLLVLAAQGFAIFVTGIARRNRIALSFCGLWGVLSFSVSGFTFPVPAMPQLISDEALLSALCRSGFERYSYGLLLETLSGFGIVRSVAVTDFA